MKKLITLLFITITFSTFCMAQNLRVEKSLLSIKYFEDPVEITKEAFETLINSDPVASMHYKRHKGYHTANLIAGTGVGVALVGGLFSQEPESRVIWYSSAAALFVVDLLFILGRKSALNKSMESYNMNKGLGKVELGLGRIVVHF